jgi:hypothetical protein
MTRFAGALHMSAAAEFDREGAVAASIPRAHETTRTSSPYFLAEERAGAGLDRLVHGHELRDHRLVLEQHAVRDVLDRCSSASSMGFGWLKSKRRRSGATSEPF